MPALAQLDAETGERLYLDTSVVLIVAQKYVAQTGATQATLNTADAARAAELTKAMKRSPNASFMTSVLALQECAAWARNKVRNQLLKGTSWRSATRDERAAVDGQAHAQQKSMLDAATRGLHGLGVKVFHTPALGSCNFLSALFAKKYRDLADGCVSLDSMDAMHLAIGDVLGAAGFISFDQGWQSAGVTKPVWG